MESLLVKPVDPLSPLTPGVVRHKIDERGNVAIIYYAVTYHETKDSLALRAALVITGLNVAREVRFLHRIEGTLVFAYELTGPLHEREMDEHSIFNRLCELGFKPASLGHAAPAEWEHGAPLHRFEEFDGVFGLVILGGQ